VTSNKRVPRIKFEEPKSKYAGNEEPEIRQQESIVINGYDGFGGKNNNLIWNPNGGWIAYTLNNKLIHENCKSREQTVLVNS